MVIGVDLPGEKRGAFCIIPRNKKRTIVHSFKKNDIVFIRNILVEIVNDKTKVFIELACPTRRGKKISKETLQKKWFWSGFFRGIGIRKKNIVFVNPNTWQNFMFRHEPIIYKSQKNKARHTKKMSIALAKKNFPELAAQLSNNKHDEADSLNIALFGKKCCNYLIAS